MPTLSRLHFARTWMPLGVAFALVVAAADGCGGGKKVASNGGSGGNGGTSSGGSGGTITLGGSGGGGGSGADGGKKPGPYKLPPGFTQTEFGGYKLGAAFNGDTPPPVDAGTTGSDGCGTTILGVVRDFQGFDVGGHPDFQHFSGSQPTPGLVQNNLGADQKPVYTGICEASQTGPCPYGQQTTSKSAFDQWYRYAANVNKPYIVYLSLQPNGNVLTFQSDSVLPARQCRLWKLRNRRGRQRAQLRLHHRGAHAVQVPGRGTVHVHRRRRRSGSSSTESSR